MTAKAARGVVVLGQVSPVRVAVGPPARPADPVEALRRRLASQTAREHVVLDFLADDLREAGEALGALQGYLGRIEAALGDAEVSQEKLLDLARGGVPAERIDYLAEVLASVRRRVAQVAVRM